MARISVPDIPSGMDNLIIYDDDYRLNKEKFKAAGERLQELIDNYIKELKRIESEKIVQGVSANRIADFTVFASLMDKVIGETVSLLSRQLGCYIVDIDTADNVLYDY